MSPRTKLVGIVVLGLSLQGCGSQDEVETAGKAVPAAGAPAERLFSGEVLEGDGCPLLSAADVAEVVGVATSGVAANPAMDCLYAWDGGRAAVSAIIVHRSVEHALGQYIGATRDITAAEMQDGIGALDEELEEKAAKGEIRQDQAAAGGMLAGALAGDDVANADVQGVGDRASHDGNRIKVLVGNVMFDLAADTGDDFDLALSQRLAQRVIRNLEAR